MEVCTALELESLFKRMQEDGKWAYLNLIMGDV